MKRPRRLAQTAGKSAVDEDKQAPHASGDLHRPPMRELAEVKGAGVGNGARVVVLYP